MQESYEFIESMEMKEVPMIGNKFTRFNLDGIVMGRSDHFCLVKG